MKFIKFIHRYVPPNLRFPNTKADIISRWVRSEKSKGWGYQNKLSSVIWFLELSQHYSTAEYHDYTENRLQWRHNEHDSVWNHQPRDCLLNRLFRRRSKRTWKLRVTGLCVGNSLGPVNSPHKWPVTRKKFQFDDVIMTDGTVCCLYGYTVPPAWWRLSFFIIYIAHVAAVKLVWYVCLIPRKQCS